MRKTKKLYFGLIENINSKIERGDIAAAAKVAIVEASFVSNCLNINKHEFSEKVYEALVKVISAREEATLRKIHDLKGRLNSNTLSNNLDCSLI